MSHIKTLHDGYTRFKSQSYEAQKDRFQSLATDGQKPKFLVIGCSDSRVNPAHIFDCNPGDIFMIRNVANLVPPCEMDNLHHGTSSALQFGICHLKISDIILLGHSACGGIQALMNSKEDQEPAPDMHFIETWMNIAHPAKKRCQENPELNPEHESILFSMKNLQTFPWIADRVEKGELHIHGMHFDIETGTLRQFCPEGKVFKPIE